MKFCHMCGSKLVDGAKFCSECGAAINQNAVKAESSAHYAAHASDSGTCPYCGMVLSVFSPVCPACGRTVERQKSDACREFLKKLDSIDAELMGPVETTGFESFMSTVSRSTGRFSDPVSKKETQRKERIQAMKMEFISTYHVPSDKVDLLQFINLTESLAKSYENSHDYDLCVLSEILEEKNEETYQRALELMPNDPDFLVIKRKKDAVEEEKLRLAEEERIRLENSFSHRLSRKIKRSLDNFLDE